MFATVVFAGWTDDELAGVPAADPGLTTTLTAAAQLVAPQLPGPAFGLLIELWGRLHGLVMLELLGSMQWLGTREHADAYQRAAVIRLAGDLAAIRTAALPTA